MGREYLAMLDSKGEPYLEEDAPARWEELEDGDDDPLASVR
jgi:hypothetical protein